MAGANNDINNIANEFLSVADLEIKKAQEKWDQELKFIREKLSYEYTLMGQYKKKEFDLETKYAEILAKNTSGMNKKELAAYNKQRKKIEEELKKHRDKLKDVEEKEELKKKLQVEREVSKARLEQLEEEAELFGKSLKNSAQQELEKIKLEGGFGKALKNSLGDAGKAAAGAAQKALTQGVDQAMELFVGKASRINARLQGTSKTFNKMNDVFEKNLGASPFIRYADAIDNLASMVDAGVAYNVEQRAFLMSISDKIATTFDAANGTLLKIIRIQQEDSTVYRLGAEAKLTDLFNRQYQDTTYMSDVYDDVSRAVADSVAQLGTAGGAEYEYNMQKWLGSMYSLGMSSETVTNLASAINMLATGDVSGLAGSGMQNLLVMAANKGGLAYGDLLSQGVNAKNVDVLMSNVVSYWQELATSSNQVVRKQYADLFGLDMADMIAVSNFKDSDMDALKSQFLYRDANSYLGKQFSKVASRMHISELIQNSYQNVLTGIGTTIASSPGMAGVWLINNLIKDATGGINIPFISAMGSGIGLETDLNSIVNLGMVGAGTLGQIGNVISSISNKGGLNLSSWGAEQYTTHGQGTAGIVSGVQATTSATTFVGNADSSDIYEASLHAAYDNVDTSVAGEAVDDAEKMQTAITESLDPNVSAILEILRQVSTGNALRVKVEDYGLISSF